MKVRFLQLNDFYINIDSIISVYKLDLGDELSFEFNYIDGSNENHIFHKVEEKEIIDRINDALNK